MKKAFNIPAINNRLEALARYLKVDNSDNIECLEFGGFRYQGKTYFVLQHAVRGDTTIEFNGNLWTIRKVSDASID